MGSGEKTSDRCALFPFVELLLPTALRSAQLHGEWCVEQAVMEVLPKSRGHRTREDGVVRGVHSKRHIIPNLPPSRKVME